MNQLGNWQRWLLPALFIIVTAFAWALRLQADEPHAAQYDVIINEWSQGNGGSREWVELVVTSGTLDLRGWALDDGTAGSGLLFADNDLWSAVAPGTVIVVYNGSDRDSALPPDDDSAADFVLILPHNGPYFSGGWQGFSNSTVSDNPQIADALGTVVHDFSIAPGATAALHPAANESIAFWGDSAENVANPTDWSGRQPASADTVTPGNGNSPANSGWIDALRGTVADEADLLLQKSGPPAAQGGDTLIYDVTIANVGSITATGVIITDTLPSGLTYVSDTSGWPTTQPGANQVRWQAGALPPGDSVDFNITVSTANGLIGSRSNAISGTTSAAESNLTNNSATATTVFAAPSLVINEILADDADGDANGDGDTSGSADEFVEIVNNTASAADLSGWTLRDSIGTRHTFPTGTIVPSGCAVVVFGGGTPTGAFGGSVVQTSGGLGLNNSGDSVTLANEMGVTVLSYAYGSEADAAQSVTRSPDIVGTDPLIQHSLVPDAGGALFSPGTRSDGTPFDPDCLRADLALSKEGPSTAAAGDLFQYTISLANDGSLDATGVVLTDTLPAELTYVADDSGWPLAQPQPGTLVWQVGTLPLRSASAFNLTVAVADGVNGTIVNEMLATTDSAEFNLANNADSHVTLVGQVVLINALHYYGYEGSDDEAVELINVGDAPVDLSGWRISKFDATRQPLPALTIPAGATVWITNDSAAFARQFGFAPDGTMAWPDFSNGGDELILWDDTGRPVDALVYGNNGNTAAPGWNGPPVQPYGGTALAKAGQIIYRMRDQATGLPVSDANRAQDWAQSTDDIINGRKTRYPGWDLDAFFATTKITEAANVTVAVAPDNAYETVVAAINSAESTIDIELLVLTNHKIMEALVNAAQRGVAVTVLLEGTPANRTAIFPQQLTLCKQLAAAGGECWFMINETDGDSNSYDRYDNLHAKFFIIDGERVLISSENMTGSSLPFDDKSDGTFGRRGLVLEIDAPGVVSHLQRVFSADFDLANHYDPDSQYGDLLPWTPNHPVYGNEYGDPGEVELDVESGGITYTVRYPNAVTFSDTFDFEIITSPENSLRSIDSLIGLVNRAGPGDTVLVQQLDERYKWGADELADPSPRMAAYLAAARRGATVRILLDSYITERFPYDPDDPSVNPSVCLYVRTVAQQEQLNLECALGNPAGLGIHNKMVLVKVDGSGYAHVGSINGSESSSKTNRELAIQIQSNAIYAFLAEMFAKDWPHDIYMPVVMNQYLGTANHPLISELLYNPRGMLEEDEFIELVNPTSAPWDLSNFSLSDAMDRSDFADLRRFPDGTILPPRQALVVAQSAVAYQESFTGQLPDFEILDTHPGVPDLLDDLTWGSPGTFLKLGNRGDLVILRDPAYQVVDVVAYWDSDNPPDPVFLSRLLYFVESRGGSACGAVVTSGASLERFPYWRDTDKCPTDFREAVNPSPGELP